MTISNKINFKTQLVAAIKHLRSMKMAEDYPDFNIGTISIITLAAFLLVIAAFTKIELPIIYISNPFDLSNYSNVIKYFNYIPQVPVVILIASVLGPNWGLMAVSIYFMAGITFFPLFAGGGGPSYFTQVGCGYILGFLLATFLVGNILKKRDTHFQTVKAVLAGVLAIHLTGIVYMVLLMFFKGEQLFLMLDWIWLLSGIQILYDLAFSLLIIISSKFIRTLIGFVTNK